MKVQNKTYISGEIYFEYAYLDYKVCFKNESGGPIGADYAFALPKGALISDARIVCEDGQSIKTSAISVSHGARINNDAANSAVLRRIDDTTYIFSIGCLCSGITSLKIKVYIPCGEELKIPLTVSLGGGEGGKLTAEISLFLHCSAQCMSPTHKLTEKFTRDEVRLSTGEISADRDFCLRIKRAEKKNTIVAAQKSFEGKLLCRFYPNKEQEETLKAEKLLILFDATGSLLYGAKKAGLELICELFEGFGKEAAVLVAEETPRMLTDGFWALNEENASRLLERLSTVQTGGGSLKEAIEYAKAIADVKTAVVLIAGTRLVEGDLVSGSIRKIEDGLCTVTLGGTRGEKTFGKPSDVHIYGEDNIAERAEEVLKKLSSKAICSAEVYIDKEKAHIINATEEYVTVYAEYSGESLPKEYVLKLGDKKQMLKADDISVYKSFAPIDLAYADFMLRRLEERLIDCAPEEVQSIRRLMEEIGVKYSVLNSETVFAATIEGTKTAVIKTLVANSAVNPYRVFEERVSRFGEADDEDKNSQYFKERFNACADIIVKSMRADGAICTMGEINPDIRKKQTLIALLSLVAGGLGDKYKAVIEKGRLYIKGYDISPLEFTCDRGYAKEQLIGLWREDIAVSRGFVPDLLTACRILIK